MSNLILSGRPEDGEIVQAFGALGPSRLALGEAVRVKSVSGLNRLLAHTMALRYLYKKAHWQTSGVTFYAARGFRAARAGRKRGTAGSRLTGEVPPPARQP